MANASNHKNPFRNERVFSCIHTVSKPDQQKNKQLKNSHLQLISKLFLQQALRYRK